MWIILGGILAVFVIAAILAVGAATAGIALLPLALLVWLFTNHYDNTPNNGERWGWKRPRR